MAEDISFGLSVPQAMVGLAQAVEFGIDRIRLAFLLKLGNRGKRHRDLGVNHLLASRDAWKIEGSVDHSVQATDMGNQTGRIHSLSHQVYSLFHVISVATACPDNMVGLVVNVVEIELGAEIGVSGA